MQRVCQHGFNHNNKSHSTTKIVNKPDFIYHIDEGVGELNVIIPADECIALFLRIAHLLINARLAIVAQNACKTRSNQ